MRFFVSRGVHLKPVGSCQEKIQKSLDVSTPFQWVIHAWYMSIVTSCTFHSLCSSLVLSTAAICAIIIWATNSSCDWQPGHEGAGAVQTYKVGMIVYLYIYILEACRKQRIQEWNPTTLGKLFFAHPKQREDTAGGHAAFESTATPTQVENLYDSTWLPYSHKAKLTHCLTAFSL